MTEKYKCLLLAIVLSTSCLCINSGTAVAAPSATAQNDNELVVEAEGHGATKMEALKTAWSEAVRMGVGMYMSSKTAVIDEKITEEIVAHSRGRVNSYEEISSVKGDEGWAVKIRVRLEKDILEETAAVAQNQSIDVHIDKDIASFAKGVIASKTTAEQQKQTVTGLIATLDVPNIEDFLTLKCKIIKNTDKLYSSMSLAINMDAYNRYFVRYLIPIFDQIAERKEEKYYSQMSIEENKLLIKLSNTEDAKYDSKILGAYNMHLKENVPAISIAIDEKKYITYIFTKYVYTELVNKFSTLFTNDITVRYNIESSSNVFTGANSFKEIIFNANRKDQIRYNTYPHIQISPMFKARYKKNHSDGFGLFNTQIDRCNILLELTLEELDQLADLKASYKIIRR